MADAAVLGFRGTKALRRGREAVVKLKAAENLLEQTDERRTAAPADVGCAEISPNGLLSKGG